MSRPSYLLLIPWPFDNPGGVHNVARNLAEGIENRGEWEVLACELDWNHQGSVSAIPGPGRRRFRIGCFSPFGSEHRIRGIISFLAHLPGTLRNLHRFCRKHNVLCINAHFVGLEYLPLLMLKWVGLFPGRLILSFHGSDIRSIINTRGFERRLHLWQMRGADALVTCSEGLREELLAFFPRFKDKTVSIPNGIDIEKFLRSRDSSFSLAAGLAGRPVVLNVGAFEYKKGHDVLLRAFAQVKDRFQEAVLVIAGQRSSTEMQRLAGELGLSDTVVFFENLSHGQIASLFELASVFVFSSRWERGVCGEGFAMALLEAAAARKPVVSTRSCGVSELITDEETGLIVPTEDPRALAGAIVTMLAEPHKAARMAEQLFERVRQNFTWSDACKKYLSLISPN